MSRSKPLTIFLLFLCLAASAAALKVSYEGWMVNANTFSYDSRQYQVMLSADGKLLLLKGDPSISIGRNSCVDLDYKRFCYNYSDYDKDLDLYKAYATIYELEPVIQITRTLDTDTMQEGKTATMTVIINNTGDIDAKSLDYIDDFPDGIIVTDVSNANLLDKTVFWSGTIKKGDYREITFDIEPDSAVDKYTKGVARYNNGDADIEVYSDQLRIYAPATLELNISTTQTEYQKNEKINITLDLFNKAAGDIMVDDLVIDLPDGSELYSKPDAFSYSDGRLSWSGKISEGNNRSFRIQLKAVDSGDVSVFGEYTIDGTSHIIDKKEISFTTDEKGVEITTSLADSESVETQQAKRFFFKVRNNNQYLYLNNITFSFTTGLPGFINGSIGSLGPNQTALVYDTEILMPQAEASNSYPLRINVSYMEGTTLRSDYLDRTIIVTPKQSLKISLSPASGDFDEVSPISFIATIENPSDMDINNVYVKIMPDKGIKISGATSTYVNVNHTSTLDALSFAAMPDIVTERTNKTVNCIVSYNIDGEEMTIRQSSQLVILPRKPKVTVEKSISKSDLDMGEIAEISYVITNDGTDSISGLTITATQDQFFDTVNKFDIDAGNLDPGEKASVKGEGIRPKASGSQDIGQSVLYYKDRYGRVFNQTSNAVAVTVAEKQIMGSALNLTQNSSGGFAAEGIRVALKVSNVGSDIAKSEGAAIANTTTYTDYRFPQAGQYDIGHRYLEYSGQGNTYRAYSNDLIITVEEKPQTQSSPQAAPVEQETKVISNISMTSNSTALIQPPKKQNVFEAIFAFFRRLFRK